MPDILTTQVTPHLACMKGTGEKPARCHALLGDVGAEVRCTIYEHRPSPCRKFHIHGESGISNDDCNRARAHFGLPPLANPLPDVPDSYPTSPEAM